MPRVATALLRKAYTIDPVLPALLAPCRDIHAAKNELRWLREHVEEEFKARRVRDDAIARKARLRQLVRERNRGKPLQYILGTEYFADLEIQCRPGVLIPRQETAASITYLTRLLRDASNLPSELRILDLCTGTGCIPLLLQHQMSSYSNSSLHILGVDISEKALSLAEYNHRRGFPNTELRGKHQIQFIKADIMRSPAAGQEDVAPSLALALNQARLPQFWDILISNPPYISPSQYWKSTTRSVRHYEPKLALVPGSDDLLDDLKHGDLFYPALLATACDLGAKIALFEVADMEQALRVARTARELDVFSGIEIWRDEPSAAAPASENEDGFSILGEGNGRSVLCYRGDGAMWLGKTSSDATKD